MPAKPGYMSDAQWNALTPEEQARVAVHAEAGGSNVWKPGDRISRAQWDAMSQGERDAIGLSTEADYKAAHRAYQARWHPGGDIYQEHSNIGQNALELGLEGAQNWSDIYNIFLQAGLGADDPWMKQMRMAYEGTADPTGTWHLTPNGWINVATSDLTAKDKPTWDTGAFTGGGLEAVFQSGGGDMAERVQMARNLDKWFGQGTSSWEGHTPGGGWYNTRPDGSVDYIDRWGNPVSGAPGAAPPGMGGSSFSGAPLSGSSFAAPVPVPQDEKDKEQEQNPYGVSLGTLVGWR